MLVPLEKPTRDVTFGDDRYKFVEDNLKKTKQLLPSFIQAYKKLLAEADKLEEVTLDGYEVAYDILEDLDAPDRELIKKRDYMGKAHKPIMAFLRANKGIVEELAKAQ